jgi:hypothetical protein
MKAIKCVFLSVMFTILLAVAFVLLAAGIENRIDLQIWIFQCISMVTTMWKKIPFKEIVWGLIFIQFLCFAINTSCLCYLTQTRDHLLSKKILIKCGAISWWVFWLLLIWLLLNSIITIGKIPDSVYEWVFIIASLLLACIHRESLDDKKGEGGLMMAVAISVIYLIWAIHVINQG